MNEFETDNTENWEKYANLYDQNIGDDGDEFHRELIDPAILEICGNLDGKNLIDAGCGNGYFSAKLIKLGASRVIGIDRSKRLIDIARKKFGSPRLLFDIFDLNQGFSNYSEPIDIIIASMVLQYMHDLEAFSKNAYQLLQKGSKVVISIDHPFHMAIMRALRLNDISTPKFIDDTPYFQAAYCKKNSLWDKAVLGYYHRPVEQYISPFLRKEFCLTNFKEIGRSVNIGKTSEIIPRVLILEFSK